MGMIGCGIIFSSLLLGAMSGSISLMLEIMAIGSIPIVYEIVRTKKQEQKMRQWRNNFPPYGY